MQEPERRRNKSLRPRVRARPRTPRPQPPRAGKPRRGRGDERGETETTEATGRTTGISWAGRKPNRGAAVGHAGGTGDKSRRRQPSRLGAQVRAHRGSSAGGQPQGPNMELGLLSRHAPGEWRGASVRPWLNLSPPSGIIQAARDGLLGWQADGRLEPRCAAWLEGARGLLVQAGKKKRRRLRARDRRL